jgi:predicted ABC-type ATPase
MVWWDNILSFFQSKNYTISLIYPVVSDVNTIVSRADKRGTEIFRFVPPEAIRESIEGAKKNIKRILGLPLNRFNNIYIYYNDDARFHSFASSQSNKEGLLQLFKEKTIYMKENDKIIRKGSETSFMTQLIGKDIAFYKSNGERLNSNSCKITY